jgi:hypothetical protein
VAQIVKDLKDFSRVDNDQTWQWASLQQGIDSTLNIVASELKYKADVIKHYTPCRTSNAWPHNSTRW